MLYHFLAAATLPSSIGMKPDSESTVSKVLWEYFPLLERKLKFASCHAPWKHTAGCKTVKQIVAMEIIAPSRIMNMASSLRKSRLLNPPASSAHRYTLRTKIVIVATKRPVRISLETNL
jgi:hypothetical protein